MLNWMGLPIWAAGVAIIWAAGVAISFAGSQQPSMTAAMTDDKTYGDPPVDGDPFIDEGGEG